MVYLAGDIGGTKTHLALYREDKGALVTLKDQKFSSKKYSDLKTIVKEFLRDEKVEAGKACFGIAGPVRNGKSQATNLPWLVDSERLVKELHIDKVCLINDLEANAYGLNMLKDEELFTLNKGDSKAEGNRAIVSAGTGLGEAGVYFDGKKYHPFACEGGHVDFAPRNDLEDELLRYLRKKFGHVSYERVLSGPGLYNLYSFIIETKKEREDADVLTKIQSGDSPRLISEMGLNEISKACKRTLELFVSIYGAEAGNVALKMLALGGLYIGGGIAPHILSVMKEGEFIDSFKRKGRFCDLLKEVPVRVILNDNTALLGAMYYAKYMM